MNQNNFFRIAIILLIVLVNIGCDQISKSIVRDRLDDNANIQLIDNHVVLTKVENTGAFLSAGDSLPPLAKSLILSLFPALTLLFLMYWTYSQRNLSKGALFGLCCVVGGGVGNVFDRIVHGSVTDFLYMHVGIFRTGIFNFADVSITAGVLTFLVFHWFSTRKL